MNNSSQRQETHLNRARASLRQSLSQYNKLLRQPRPLPIQTELSILATNLEKLDQNVICIAAFGLVSRGKSAVLNGLVGEKILPTGPVHGVTQWPRSVRWRPHPQGKVQVELIDTPGLDEVGGEVRADMARDVARQADLILFVVAGDITQTEYDGLFFLAQTHKPLILVFNKIDLYPEPDLQSISRRLQQLGSDLSLGDEPTTLTTNEMVRVAAEPMARQVRVELPDGEVRHEWETPEPQMEELRAKIVEVLNREGRSLLALNALVQAQQAEVQIAQKTRETHVQEAEKLIWNYARSKGIGVALSPIALLDIPGGAIADLALIRALARLYGLPLNTYEASQLWKTILLSSGGLVLGEIGTSILFGFGKTAATAMGASGESATALSAWVPAAIVQGAIAGYGAYRVGRVTEVYLQQGCTWGTLGPSTIIQEILQELDSQAILYRLRAEIESSLPRNWV
ncbi:GTP-binding protein [Roseofilum casamattae]|uniref:GTP-binding protein n=1 Tax=Roseofilum casamattae BLCC-M143 TaxID=3022442 RepID=A0ABT7C4F2_9CYAN|nr:GTP-binding protein [Roseofilum casamattae]MDJ1185588.1 GTP-binding protein [Roseofilum casamattae BLCC-M143]